MMRAYRIRVYGKPRQNPDAAMLAHIVILIGRRLHAEHLQQRRTAPTAGKTGAPQNLPRDEDSPWFESDTDAGGRDG